MRDAEFLEVGRARAHLSPAPLALSGWQAHLTSAYNGTLTKGDQTRTACACRDATNAVPGE